MDLNREICYRVLYAVEKDGQYSNMALNNYIKRVDEVSEGFVREIVYGTLERKLYLEFCISKLINGKIKDVRRSDRIILSMALYQMLFMDSVPSYSAVDEAVKLAKKFSRGREKFINAVLRNLEKNRYKIDIALENMRDDNLKKYMSVKYSFAPYIVDKITADYGNERAHAIFDALNRKPGIYIRTNLLKIKRDELIERLREEGFEAVASPLCKSAIKVKGKYLIDSNLYKEGYFSVQDVASQILIDMLKPQRRECIIDVCSAPGGKAFGSCETMKNTGLVVSRDVYEHKIKKMRKEAARLGIENIDMGIWDAEIKNTEFTDEFDGAICDVPCSGFGVISKKPEIKYKKAQKEIEKLPEKQLRILKNTAEYVKVGGRIIYSTCTINKDENQGVVREFLNRNNGYKLVEERLFLPDEQEADGFYIAKIIREE